MNNNPLTPAKYTKKPVTIEAVVYDGTNGDEIKKFTQGGCYMRLTGPGLPDQFMIRTLEGEHVASVGDFIIKGIKGEFYPCKPDVFALTYSPAKVEAEERPTRQWSDRCECGHGRDNHFAGRSFACELFNCECSHFRLAATPVAPEIDLEHQPPSGHGQSVGNSPDARVGAPSTADPVDVMIEFARLNTRLDNYGADYTPVAPEVIQDEFEEWYRANEMSGWTEGEYRIAEMAWKAGRASR